MSDNPNEANAYLVQLVQVINEAEQVAYVETEAGAYVVESIPNIGDDAREAGILFVTTNLEEATEKYENIYG